MTDIENRLRDEFRAEARRAQPHMLRELRLPPRRRAARARSWLAPVAAVVAVAAVITGVRFASGDLHAPPAATAQGVLPPFYVTLQVEGLTSTMLMVRRSADGAVVTRVAAPPGERFEGVSAASDGRTFVLSTVSGSRANMVFRFYRTLLAADGRFGPLTALPLTVRSGSDMYYVTGIALSPDGGQLAVAEMAGLIQGPRNGDNGLSAFMPGPARIEVVSLRTGELRTWTASSQVGFPTPTGLSWADQGRQLAYLSDKLSGLLRPPDSGMRMYLLDTARPGRELTGSSALVPLRTAGAAIESALMTESGSQVIAWVGPSQQGSPLVLGEFSARTGELLRVLYRGPGGDLLSADSSGRHLLISGLTEQGMAYIAGRVNNGLFTALPISSPSLLVQAAW